MNLVSYKKLTEGEEGLNKKLVPAIERANRILTKIGEKPNEYRMIDLSKELDLNKSSMYSLLYTMTDLGWITKKEKGTYELGPYLGRLNHLYFRNFSFIQSFYNEAPKYATEVGETIQLGVLKGTDVLYLGKIDAISNVRLVTDPGMTFPAYASAIGKIQMIDFKKEEIEKRFRECNFEKKTSNTTSSIDELYKKIQFASKEKVAIENEESAYGFHCVAAPIYNYEKKIIAGVSFSMQTENWNEKFEMAKSAVLNLSEKLSQLTGF